MLPSDVTLPAIDRFNEVWFTSGTLAVQCCASCEQLQHPPEEVCRGCGAMTFTHRVFAPTGRIHSRTVVHYAANKALEAAVPYVVVLVELDDNPRIRVLGNLLDPRLDSGESGDSGDRGDATRGAIGAPVFAEWSEHVNDEGVTIRLPNWRLA